MFSFNQLNPIDTLKGVANAKCLKAYQKFEKIEKEEIKFIKFYYSRNLSIGHLIRFER